MRTFFISGTGTEIGKTLVTTILLRQIRMAKKPVEAIKPIITGFDENNLYKTDTAMILNELGREVSKDNIDQISPWRFKEAISPNLAADSEGRSLIVEKVAAFCKSKMHRDQILLIEGIGGVMVPLNDTETVLDLIAKVGAPIVLVVGSYLGTLSHTLTAFQAVSHYGIKIAGVVISESYKSPVSLIETQRTLSKFRNQFPFVILPRIKDIKEFTDVPCIASELGIL
mgnify:CR=1 FL=1|tara:strand:+ start:287 stop:967 length:681 start_codon:yes stop_codon:yes gene_type:complete